MSDRSIPTLEDLRAFRAQVSAEVQDFSRYVDAAKLRAAGLHATLALSDGPAESTRNDFEFVREEAEVAYEELRQQNEELQRTRVSVETERERYHDLFHS